MSIIHGYRDLDVWQKAMDLVEHSYRLTNDLPKSEGFGLKAQLRRASISVPSNIAEGQGRATTRDDVRHLAIAHGSLMEVETQIQIAGRLGFIPENKVLPFLEESAKVGRMLNALSSSLRSRIACGGFEARDERRSCGAVPCP